MPLANRVMPDGALFATPLRGTLMGNRGGRFHDPATRALTARRWASRQWICCELAFRNRRRSLWGDGYTELFFCDEVSALAAGHRPCFECRRADAADFAKALRDGLGLAETPRAGAIDRLLHEQRLDGRARRLHPLPGKPLPDGAMIMQDNDFFARRQGVWLRWSFSGYEPAQISVAAQTKLVTPPAIVAALGAGYAPRWHGSAI